MLMIFRKKKQKKKQQQQQQIYNYNNSIWFELTAECRFDWAHALCVMCRTKCLAALLLRLAICANALRSIQWVFSAYSQLKWK